MTLNPENPMLPIKKKDGDNGRTPGNLSPDLSTQERRLFNISAAAAKAAKWIITLTASACFVWFGLVRRVDALEQKSEADKAMIVLKLDEMEKRLTQRFDEVARRLNERGEPPQANPSPRR